MQAEAVSPAKKRTLMMEELPMMTPLTTREIGEGIEEKNNLRMETRTNPENTGHIDCFPGLKFDREIMIYFRSLWLKGRLKFWLTKH